MHAHPPQSHAPLNDSKGRCKTPASSARGMDPTRHGAYPIHLHKHQILLPRVSIDMAQRRNGGFVGFDSTPVACASSVLSGCLDCRKNSTSNTKPPTFVGYGNTLARSPKTFL